MLVELLLGGTIGILSAYLYNKKRKPKKPRRNEPPTPIEPIPEPVEPPTPEPIEPPMVIGKLHVEGNKILDENNNQIVLKGVNIPDPQLLDTKYWDRPNITASKLANTAVNDYHAKVIRLPILPGNPEYPTEGWFLDNGEDIYFTKHLKPLVDELTAKKIYVIIDFHMMADFEDKYSKVEQFWTYIAPKFKDNPYVLYEIFNEPIRPDNWDTWKDTIAQPAYNLIRSLAPDNLILIGGPYWSSHMLGAVDNPITGTNIVYVGHIYSNQSPERWVRDYEPLLKVAPLFITEWGFEKNGTEGGDITYGIAFEEWMKKYSLSWTVWQFDFLWGPSMFNEDWSLKKSPDGMGEFVRDLLAN